MRNIDDYELEYSKEYCENIQVQFRKRKIIELAEKYNHKTILEVGCGNSPLFIDFQDFDEMVIVEPGKQFVENAIFLSKKVNKDIKVFEAFIEELENELKSFEFDYIIISSLLHELDNPQEILSVIYNICCKNTVIHVNVPNANSIHRILAKEMGIIKDIHELSSIGKKLQQDRVYDLNQLCTMVSETGFEIIESGSYFPKFLSYSQIESMLKNGIIDNRYFEGMYSLNKYLPDYGSEIYLQVRKA